MSQRWICWSEFMQEWEAVPLCEWLVISRQDLELVAWVQEEQRGRPLYRADIDQQEVTVWRDEEGRLAWDAIHYTWLVESQIEQLAALLTARGFSGTRTDEQTLTKHVVMFQYATARLALRASQREALSLRTLSGMADEFLAQCRESVP